MIKSRAFFRVRRILTVENRGWDRFAEDHPVRHGLGEPAFTNMMSEWWADLLVGFEPTATDSAFRRRRRV